MSGKQRRSHPFRSDSPATSQSFAARYDAAIFDPGARELYEGSAFYNIGDWRDSPSGLAEAARRLVEMHLAADTREEAKGVSVVLDVGCGLGAGAAMMADHYANALVLGANLSPVQARWGARHWPRARFAAMNAVRLAVAADRVDRIHSVEAAFHFDSRERFLAEARRVLRPGGKVILTDVTYRHELADFVPPANVWAGEDEYRRRCEGAGLEVERLEDITDRTLIPFFAHLKTHGYAAEAVIQRRAMAAYYFVVLRKPED
jgi:MPBQ/MSBQ methyltransferase